MTPQPESYRLIPLTKGQFAKVSPHRFEELSRYRWRAQWNPKSNAFYAVRTDPAEGINRNTYLHRQILGLERGDRRTGDHQNHDTLDNRDDNLRIATMNQQMFNGRKHKRNKSGYKGVSFNKDSGLWFAQITIEGRNRHLGARKTAEAAYYELWVPAATKHHGEFACLG